MRLYFTIQTFLLRIARKCQNCEIYTQIWYLGGGGGTTLHDVRITVSIFHSVVDINFNKTCFPLKQILLTPLTPPIYPLGQSNPNKYNKPHLTFFSEHAVCLWSNQIREVKWVVTAFHVDVKVGLWLKTNKKYIYIIYIYIYIYIHLFNFFL